MATITSDIEDFRFSKYKCPICKTMLLVQVQEDLTQNRVYIDMLCQKCTTHDSDSMYSRNAKAWKLTQSFDMAALGDSLRHGVGALEDILEKMHRKYTDEVTDVTNYKPPKPPSPTVKKRRRSGFKFSNDEALHNQRKEEAYLIEHGKNLPQGSMLGLPVLAQQIHGNDIVYTVLQDRYETFKLMRNKELVDPASYQAEHQKFDVTQMGKAGYTVQHVLRLSITDPETLYRFTMTVQWTTEEPF